MNWLKTLMFRMCEKKHDRRKGYINLFGCWKRKSSVQENRKNSWVYNPCSGCRCPYWFFSSFGFSQYRMALEALLKNKPYKEKCPGSPHCWPWSFCPDSGRYWDIPRAAAGHKGRCGDLPKLRRVLYPLLHGSLPWACIQPGAALQCGLGWGLWVRYQYRGQHNLAPAEQTGIWPKASHLHQDRFSGGI